MFKELKNKDDIKQDSIKFQYLNFFYWFEMKEIKLRG